MQPPATDCRLAHIIPDYSERGAYAGSLEAGVYNEAGATMPNLLLMMAFGDAKLAAHLKGFLEHLVVAKELLTSDDQTMIHHVVVKDRGPLLFWLANERIPASVRACVHTASSRARLLANSHLSLPPT